MRETGGFLVQISSPAFGVHIDHVIPIAKGGHPSDIDNLQLAHWTCNRQKSDKLFGFGKTGQPAQTDAGGLVSNRLLPQSLDWTAYRAK